MPQVGNGDDVVALLCLVVPVSVPVSPPQRPPLSTERTGAMSPILSPHPTRCSSRTRFLLLPSQTTSNVAAPSRCPAARGARRPPGLAGGCHRGGHGTEVQFPRWPSAPGASLWAPGSVLSISGPAAGRPLLASSCRQFSAFKDSCGCAGPTRMARCPRPRGRDLHCVGPVSSAMSGGRSSRFQGRGCDIFQSCSATVFLLSPCHPPDISSAHVRSPRVVCPPHVGSPREGVASVLFLQWPWPSLNSAWHAVGHWCLLSESVNE